MEEVVIFAWLSCTWVDGFGMLAKALEEAGGGIYGILGMRQRVGGFDVNRSKGVHP